MGLGQFLTTSYVISFKKKYLYVLKIVEMLYLFFPYKKLSIMKLKRKRLWAGDEKQIMLSDSYNCNINLSLSLILTNI